MKGTEQKFLSMMQINDRNRRRRSMHGYGARNNGWPKEKGWRYLTDEGILLLEKAKVKRRKRAAKLWRNSGYPIDQCPF